MMIPIYICEDDPTHKKSMEYMITRKTLADDLAMEIVLSTNQPEELLAVIKEKNQIGIYFLDIELPTSKLNGLALASEIRKYDPDGYIIFVTTHSEMSYLTFQYKVGALDFIIKEQMNQMMLRIEECLEVIETRLQSKREQKQDLFVIADGELSSHIRFDDIYCFEAIGNHRIAIIAKKQEITFSNTLKEVQKQLDHRFFRSHRSCIVNMKNISTIDQETRLIHFENGIVSNVSKLKINELKKKLRC